MICKGLICTAIVSSQLNDFKYCYVSLITLSNFNQFFASREMVTSIAIEYKLFNSTFLICFHTGKWFHASLTIYLNIDHLIRCLVVCLVGWLSFMGYQPV